ncbi:MAG TPA: DUF4097 family beta strand repeat-containing protein [Ktedonobacteraceae bacterium]
MQQNEYQNHEQTPLNDRMTNSDPREISSETVPQANLQRQLPRRRRVGLVLVLCLLGLALSLGILGVTDGVAFNSMQKALPTRAFTINGHGSLVINDNSGTFHIHEGAGNQVLVQGKEYAYGLVSNFASMHVDYRQEGNLVTLDATEGWSLLGSTGITFDITVPANLDVTIHGNATDTDLTHIDGNVNAHSNSGNLELNTVNGDLNLNTTSGNIGITGEQGAVSAHSSSGNIEVKQLMGPVNLFSSSGNITLEQANLSGQDQIQSSSGDIEFTGTLDPAGTYQMNTSSGNITLKLPDNSAFRTTIGTSNGEINNAFSAPTTGSTPYATLVLKTSSGNITLEKQ